MKLDRLLSRIRAALQDYASEFEQRALAAEYTEWCTKASQRLEQIVPLIREGQDFPALQIAESAPPVLDLVRQLSFADAEKWRMFCRQRGLPTPQPFDERSVDLVNQLYGKNISETHPLYREYRQAIRTRHEEQALQVLQSIRRVNPDDANAHSEYSRLAHKIFDRRRAELVAALKQTDAAHVLGVMEAIELNDLPAREQDETWRRALRFRDECQVEAARARCLVLATQLQQIRAIGNWKDALPMLAEWDLLRGQFNFSLATEVEEGATQIREWAARLLAESEHEKELHQHWRELDTRLTELGEQAPAKKSVKLLAEELAELSAHSTTLSTELAAGNGNAPPPELVRRLERETLLLRQQLHKRRMALMTTGSVIAVLAVVLVAYLTWSNWRRQQFQTAYATLQQHFHDGAAHALADSLKDFDTHYAGLGNDPAVAAQVSRARDFVKTSTDTHDKFERELAQVTQAAEKAPPSQIPTLLANLDDLGKEAGQLSADDAPSAQATVQSWRLRLTQQLARDQDGRTTRLTDIADRASKIVAEKISPGLTAEAAQPIISAVEKILAEANALPMATDATAAEQAVRSRLEAIAKQIAALDAATREALAARTQLAQAQTLDNFLPPFEVLATNTLTNDPAVAAAHALASKNPDWTAAAQHILLPGDPETWAYLKTAGDARLQPATDDPKEDIAFTRLVRNEILNNTYTADLVTIVDDKETGRTPVMLIGAPNGSPRSWDGGEELIQLAKQIKPDGTAENLIATWRHFKGQTSKGEKFENVRQAPGSKLVERVRSALGTLTGAIREPLLRVLDDVRVNSDASPILKAYFAQELFKIMQMRPRDWGLAFSPAAKTDALELAKITGGGLLPSDWIFPPSTKLADDLKAFFERTSGVHYYPEAAANLQILLKKPSIPLHFAGYVTLEQKTQLVGQLPATATLWGCDADGRWSVLFTLHDGQSTRAAGTTEPARLTPLVYTDENAASAP
jgi:hypothetical protein